MCDYSCAFSLLSLWKISEANVGHITNKHSALQHKEIKLDSKSAVFQTYFENERKIKAARESHLDQVSDPIHITVLALRLCPFASILLIHRR